MDTIYIVIGVIVGFLVLLFIGYQAIGYRLMSGDSKLEEEQKIKCAEAIKKGEAPSKQCQAYIDKGLCPDGSCKIKK